MSSIDVEKSGLHPEGTPRKTQYSYSYQETTKFQVIARRVEDSWPQVFGLLSMCLVTIGSFWGNTSRLALWLFWIGISLGMIGNSCATLRQVPSCNQLRSDNAGLRQKVREYEDIVQQHEADFYDMIKLQLAILASQLGFGDTERVSLFKYDNEGFIQLGRYSQNPEYCKKGRGTYPVNEGSLARAWKEGKVFACKLPDPETDLESYLDAQKREWGVNKNAVKTFNMRSREYYALALDDFSFTRIAVIVFESTNVDVIVPDRIDEVMKNGEHQRLVDTMGRLRSIEPTTTYAGKEGY